MFAALFRLLFGLIVACLVGGAVQVMFALAPAELAVAGPDRWQIAGAWALNSAVAIAMVAAPLVLLVGIFGELLGVRSFAFYVLAGIFVALAGFMALYSGEGPSDPTLANSYAIAAYLTTGLVAGIAYWLVSGRFAGGRLRKRADVDTVDDVVAAVQSPQPSKPQPAAPAAKSPSVSSTGTVPVTNARPKDGSKPATA